MSARLTITPRYSAGGHQPYELLNVWVNGDIYHQGLLGIWRKRIELLPLWFPFNSYFDDSFTAQKKYIEWVEAHARQLYGDVVKEFSMPNPLPSTAEDESQTV